LWLLQDKTSVVAGTARQCHISPADSSTVMGKCAPVLIKKASKAGDVAEKPMT
jgi:hypothetical protein